jgi:hypothetical protein
MHTKEGAMRIQWAIAGLLLASLIVTRAEAYDENGYSVGFGVGVSTCAKMTDDVARAQWVRQAYEQYIDGFLSAINESLPGKDNFFLGTDQAARYKFVLQYCEANPLDLVIVAINKLVKRYKSDFPLP